MISVFNDAFAVLLELHHLVVQFLHHVVAERQSAVGVGHRTLFTFHPHFISEEQFRVEIYVCDFLLETGFASSLLLAQILRERHVEQICSNRIVLTYRQFGNTDDSLSAHFAEPVLHFRTAIVGIVLRLRNYHIFSWRVGIFYVSAVPVAEHRG